MTFPANLRTSDAIRIIRYASVDQFRAIERLVSARSIPTDVRDFAAFLATVSLPSCTIFLQRTFPRIVEADFRTDGVFIGVPMEDDATLTHNGLEALSDTLMLGRGHGPSDLIEPRANLMGLVMFNAPLRERGWPEIENAARIVRANPGSIRKLQAVIREIAQFACFSAAEFALPNVAGGLQETLLAALDRALVDCAAIAPKQAIMRGNYLKLVRQLDEMLERDPAATFYSQDLADRLGISVRTLHNALIAIRGRSLHDYIRLRRLWRVHRTLMSGTPVQVKAVALANGFWHPGEFSRSYRTLFGEPPSETLCRACGR